MAPLPARCPTPTRRWVTRVAPDPYLRVDTNDYSLDPALVGRRVEVRVDQREVAAVALDTGELACRHRASFARHRTITALEHARALRERPRRAGRDGGRGPAAGPLRRADRMSRPTTELAHLFRALKAPAAARALPKLADRARAEEWSYEQFAAALLKTETDSRDSHGGQARIKAARFPARKTLEEFDFAFQTLAQARHRPAPRPARLPRRQGERRPARPARHRQDPPRDRARDPRLPGRPPRRVPHRDRMGRAARRRPTPRPPRRRARPAAADPAADRRRGRLHPVRPAGRQPDVHARLAAATNAPR